VQLISNKEQKNKTRTPLLVLTLHLQQQQPPTQQSCAGFAEEKRLNQLHELTFWKRFGQEICAVFAAWDLAKLHGTGNNNCFANLKVVCGRAPFLLQQTGWWHCCVEKNAHVVTEQQGRSSH